MKVSRRWIEWAHGPGAEDGQPLAMSLCDLASAPGVGAIEVADPALIAELVDVAGLYVNPCRGDALHDMGPWWMGQPRRIISEGRASLRSAPTPNQLWVADMTYVPTWAGFIYLAIVLDVWSRRIVGWAIGERMSAELVLAALNMALQQRRPDGVIHHSDKGSQYTSVAFGERCKKMGVKPSMGSVGDAYDNAMAESFFATLECELIDRRSWQTKTEARLALFTYIEGWYNPRRRHSALGQISPANFERRHAQKARANGQRVVHGIPTGGACVAGATPPVDIPAPEVLVPT